MKHRLNDSIVDLKLSGIRLLNQEAAEVDDVISLTIGEPMFNTSELVKEAAIQAIEDNQTKYPPYQGLIQLRSKIIEFEKRFQNIDYHINEVLITQGASGALFTALGAILNPDDEVIIFDPSYVAYYPIVKTFKAIPVIIDTTPEEFQLSYEKITSKLSKNTKAIIINSPNNPTGVIYNKDSIDVLTRIMDENDIYIISDDVYNQLIYEGTPTFLVQNQKYKSQIIYCQSLSKPYAMTGWRIGYVMADEAIVEQALKVQQFMAAGIPPFIQHAAIKAFDVDVEPIVKQYQKNYEIATQILDQHNIQYVKPKGAFYLFINISQSNKNSWDFTRDLLRDEKVAVVPGIVFSKNSDSFVRLSFCTDYNKVVEGVKRFSKYLTK